jgi:hypothetical protein
MFCGLSDELKVMAHGADWEYSDDRSPHIISDVIEVQAHPPP